MAVPEQTPYIEHTGNSATTSFSLGFQCESKDHLIVLVDEIEPPIATWSLNNGNVVFTTAPAAGKKITVQRNTPFGRTANYQSFNNSFRPQTVNVDFDRIWWKLQELGVADWLMKLYVDRLHQQQEQEINDLKDYVDDRDDELRAYLMEEIRKQGVALDQLDDYYNYLMQRLAQIAVDKGWDAAFVVDASGKNQHEINKITLSSVNIISHGAKSDVDATTKIGTDNFDAIKNAVYEANTKNMRCVDIPAGDWYVKLTDAKQIIDLALGGTATLGVKLRGAGRKVTTIWVDAESEENVLFRMFGGSGNDTARSIEGVEIRTIPSNKFKGVAVQINGGCFAVVDNFIIVEMHVGLDFLNGVGAGTFTEFATISNGRLNRCNINRRYQVNSGDNSFHGINIFSVQNQVKSGGIGVQVVGITQPAYLYNSMWLEQYFGGTNCTMLDLQNCNTDNLWGNLTFENPLTIKTRNAYANFEFKGNLSGIGGTITYDIFEENSKGFGNIVFNNTSSLQGRRFSNPAISNYAPSVLPEGEQDKHSNGVVSTAYRIGSGLGFSSYWDSVGWLFTRTDGANNILGVTPAFRFYCDGSRIANYNTSLAISSSTNSITINSDGLVPTTNGGGGLGSTTNRWSILRIAGLDLSQNSLYPHNSAVFSCGTASNYIKDLFIQNAPTVVSDRSKKEQIQLIDDALLDAWEDVQFQQWKLKDAVLEKGSEEARWHVGFIAQQVRDTLIAHELDWTRYGLITYESWGAVAYKSAVVDDFGDLVSEEVEAKEAGEIYMLRMEECLAVEMAYQRRRIDKIEQILNNSSN